MAGLFSRIIKRSPPPLAYAEQKDLAHGGTVRQRLTLASNPATSPEILFYLAQHDAEPQVRLAVARNPSTPMQASSLLAVDKSVDVRMALAERLVRLLPGLDADRQAQLYAFVVEALGMLALDEVLLIRKALSSALQDSSATPPKIAAQLARDVEREVAEPILRFCAALQDADLLNILKTHPADWAAEAIAGRAAISAAVSAAVIETGNRAAGLTLIGNDGAVIDDGVMEDIIARSRQYQDWQKKLARRPQFPPAMARRLAEFADHSVRYLLAQRDDIDAETGAEIAAIFRRRLDYEESKDADAGSRVARLQREGRLNEEAVADALGMKDRAFVIAAVAALAKMPVEAAEKVFALKAAKPIVALSHRAGLSMRLALRLQQEAGQVPHQQLLYPRGGTDYPLDEAEMREQLGFLGL